MKLFKIYLYDGCNGDPCTDLECSHDEIVVVLVFPEDYPMTTTELADIVKDTQERILETIVQFVGIKYNKFLNGG